ncbi:hypothetical protein B0I35DRAFT_473287 [Stachybotrys elegans]|uniref:PH domain-containing protein n=1 Tax=Stachybotrys elegans TaxID=80388 RepID=A0A8K0T3B4_9HYPO|nr:hypothetical protein B0I35DRAFT_473287 [Stachybotrys elegans]
MASRDAEGADGPSSPSTEPPAPRRRLSMDEDLLYHKIMTAPGLRRPSNPPPYDDSEPEAPSSLPSLSSTTSSSASSSSPNPRRNPRLAASAAAGSHAQDAATHDTLPPYSTAIAIEGVFNMKHEIEHTTKRAEDRQWHTVYVTLHGTALKIYNVKKDWGWGRSRDGPSISPDNPPWIKKAKLEKSYSLLYADAGIAADYKKRRYVIRIRAETDQFLLSCVELTTFLKWLEALFSAMAIAPPLDSRDFPSDMSVPRILRIRWVNGHPLDSDAFRQHLPDDVPEVGHDPDAPVPDPRPQTAPQQPDVPAGEFQQEIQVNLEQALDRELEHGAREELESTERAPAAEPAVPHPRTDARRLSTSSYPNQEVDQISGKWFPEHRWSSAHDLLYAKLCYNNLYFRSPRKSKYIISGGKEWFVDWSTGRMVRVLPPQYGEINDYIGPWQFVHVENTRI